MRNKHKEIYGIDFGGTNLRIGKVNPETGSLLGKIMSFPVKNFSSNNDLNSAILQAIEENARVGISAAGDVDEDRLVIKFSPNSRIKGKINFGAVLKENGRDVVMTNDMKAAVQAVARFEEAVRKGKSLYNVAVATYSSGFNAAVARKGINATQAELGHIKYKPDSELFCGCGQRGHLEIFVSGNGAASMAKQYFLMTHEINHPIIISALGDYNEKARKNKKETYKLEQLCEEDAYNRIILEISAAHVYRAYKENPNQNPQKDIRKTQTSAISHSFGVINSAFNPIDVLVCMGGLTEQEELFNNAINDYMSGESGSQLPSLNIPRVCITSLPAIGVQGAAAYYLSRREN
ncbi:MAG: ROK family protein [Nanoarchaeota archaeon]|nr:ROK family protein [Nanoarchaeota archaeon]MBU4086220.1 ROK family protein [Nanoarchaeota archaeon]